MAYPSDLTIKHKDIKINRMDCGLTNHQQDSEVQFQLEKWIYRTVGPSLGTCIESLAHCCNVASLSLFYWYYFGRCSSELAQLTPLPYSQRVLFVILIDCMICLSNFYFSPNDTPSKTMKNVFISSKILFSFLRYSNFCIFVFPSFSPCQPLL